MSVLSHYRPVPFLLSARSQDNHVMCFMLMCRLFTEQSIEEMLFTSMQKKKNRTCFSCLREKGEQINDGKICLCPQGSFFASLSPPLFAPMTMDVSGPRSAAPVVGPWRSLQDYLRGIRGVQRKSTRHSVMTKSQDGSLKASFGTDGAAWMSPLLKVKIHFYMYIFYYLYKHFFICFFFIMFLIITLNQNI